MVQKCLKGMSAVLFAALILCNAAAADEYHYVNQLIGDRASGMAGAYTGVSDDVSGLYYNPAGIMYSSGTNLSASVNAYFDQKKTYDSVIGGNGWDRRSRALLPNFFGITQPIGKYKLGFSYAVPDSISENQDQTFYDVPSTTPGITVTKYVINFNNDDNTYNFGPSLAAEITKDITAGMTLYFHQRKNQIILNQILTKNTTPVGFEWQNTYYELNEWGFRPILGVMWAPAEKLSVGVAVSKVMLMRSSTDIQSTSANWDATGGTPLATGPTNSNPDAKRKYPFQVRTGVAYFVSSSLLVDLDLTYSGKVSDPEFGDRVAVVNAAAGAEYYFSKNLAVRGGFYTDMANTPEIKSDKTGQSENVDIYGLSASISSFTRNTSITLGGSYSMGSGEAQLISGSTAIQDVETTGWTIYLSSSYSY